jgi:hypothetical protein
MKAIFNNQIKKIIKEAEEVGLKIKIQESSDNPDIVMIGCPSNKKVVMLVLDKVYACSCHEGGSKKHNLRAFTINLKKWNWADAEGFTDKDLIGTLSDQVFKEIKLPEIVQKLS